MDDRVPLCAIPKPLHGSTNAPLRRPSHSPVSDVGSAASDLLKRALDETLAGDAAIRQAATDALADASERQGFVCRLLAVATVDNEEDGYSLSRACCFGSGGAKARRTSAAVYLKNFLKKRWVVSEGDADDKSGAGGSDGGGSFLIESERDTIRDNLLDALLHCALPDLRKTLAECFRIVCCADFPSAWPSLLSQLCDAVTTHVDDATCNNKENVSLLPDNALTAVAGLSKQFTTFRNVCEAKEEAPPELVDVARVVFHPLLASMVEPMAAVAAAPASDMFENEGALSQMHTLAKAFSRITRVFMPSTLLEQGRAARWLQAFLTILSHVLNASCSDGGDGDGDDSDDELPEEAELMRKPRWKLAKRLLQIFLNFEGRHRALLEPHTDALLECFSQALAASGRRRMPERIAALCLDTMACCAEFGSGAQRRATSNRVAAVFGSTIFPLLCLGSADAELWEEDSDEFVQRNLELDADLEAEAEASNSEEELYSARKSALRLLSVVIGGESAAEAGAGGSSGGKGKRRGGKGKGKKKNPARAPLRDGMLAFLAAELNKGMSLFQKENVAQLCGVVLAYGALVEWMGRPAVQGRDLSALLRTSILPLCGGATNGSATSPPPEVAGNAAVRAHAVWLVGKSAELLPKLMLKDVAAVLCKSMRVLDEEGADDDAEDGDAEDRYSLEKLNCWKPVRVTAGTALYILLGTHYEEHRAILRTALPEMVDLLLAAAEAEQCEERAHSAGMPIQVFHLLAKVSDTDILPFAGPVSSVMAQHALAQAREGRDVAGSASVMALGAIADTLETQWDGDDEDDEDDEDDDDDGAEGDNEAKGGNDAWRRGLEAFEQLPDGKGVSLRTATAHLCNVARELLGQLWDVAATAGNNEFDDDDGGGCGRNAGYCLELTQMLYFLLQHGPTATSATSASAGGATTAAAAADVAIMSCFVDHMSSWIMDEGMKEDGGGYAWSSLADIMRRDGEGMAEIRGKAAAVALRSFEAAHLARHAVRGACNALTVAVVSQPDWWRTAGAESVKTVVSRACTAMRALDDARAGDPIAKRALPLAICHLLYTHADAAFEGLCSEDAAFDVVAALIALCPTGENGDGDEEVEDGVLLSDGQRKVVVFASLELVARLTNACSAGQRRRLGSLLERAHAIVNVFEEENAEEDVDDDEDEDEDEDEDDEEEEDDEDDEEDDEGGESEEETEEEFLERYAQMARECGGGDDDEDADEDDADAGVEEIFDAVDVVAHYRQWFAAHRDLVGSVASRLSELSSAMAQLDL